MSHSTELPLHLDHQGILDLIANRGIQFTSAIQISVIEFSAIQNLNGQVTISQNTDWGTGFYLRHNLKDAFLTINEYDGSKAHLLDLSEDLVGTRNLFPNKLMETPEPQLKMNITIDIRNEGPWTENYVDEVHDLLGQISSIISNEDHNIKFRVNINGQLVHKTFQSSYTSRIIQKFGISFVSVELYLKEFDRTVQTSTFFGGIAKEELSHSNISRKLRESISALKQLSSGKLIKPNKYPVVLSPDSTYSLIHESIGHGCEADQVINGDSFLTNRMGRKVASSQLTILDDPHVRGAGWSEYDDEGIKTKGTILVEEGVLVDYLHTRKTAQALNMATTGNARCYSYLTPPQPRQSNLFIEPKDWKVEEMIEEVKNGIMVGPTTSASMSIYTGEIIIGSQYGYEIKNGEIAQILNPFAISGNSLEILSNVEQVGSSFEKMPTYCLKEDNKVAIGAYAPFLGISECYLG